MRRCLSVLLLALLLSACGGTQEDPDSAPQAQAESPTPAEPILCPLTGLEAPGDFDEQRPALAVKIDNAPPARPQAGLLQADVVYEELSEGGLTRFLTIFHCGDTDSVGPIRSARTADPDILQEYAPALFAYSGANSQVLQKVASTEGVVDLKHGSNGDAYTRESSRKAPFDLFSSTARLRSLEAAAAAAAPPEPGFEFDEALLNPPSPGPSPSADATAPAASPAAPAGTSVSFSYSNTNSVRFTYDPATKAYQRFHGDAQHKVVSGEPVSVVNVVVMKVVITPGTVRDASGTLTQDTSVTGSGELTVLRGGIAVTGTWNRPSVGAKTTFTDSAGQPIKLAPGSTWFHLVPSDRQVSVQ
ncbi:MAG: DUF3048 domain-containing protein [Actinomycetota bacterium]